MLYDGKYLTDDEFLSHFCMDQSCSMQLNSLVEGDQEFRSVSGKLGKRSSMLHVMVLLKFLGSFENEAALAKLGLMLGISKGAVNNYMRQACNAILKHCEQVIKLGHPVPPDWFNETIEELDQDDKLNQSVEQSCGDTRCNQVFAYMSEER